MSIQKTNTALTANSNSTASFDNSMIYTSIQAGEAAEFLTDTTEAQEENQEAA